MIGEVIGNYRIESVLGQGGMGVVYRAQHVTLGRGVALKMLLPQISHDAGMVQRFFNEARASSTIDHPGIVEIHDFGTHHDGRAFIVMALLQGESLEGRLRRGGPLPPLLGASLLAQAASALSAAHARGIVHRDLKPDNLFLVPNEMMPDGLQVKLLDFGIAKLANDQSSFKTQTGALIGTPAYMSPEQCMGASDLDHRTDLYSLGCILFHVLVGRPPFTSDHGTGMLIAAHLRDVPPDVRSLDPRIPDSLAHIVARLLEKDPARRFQTALDVRAALVDAGAHAPTQPGPSVPRVVPAPTPRFTGPEAYGLTTAPTGPPPPSAKTTTSGAAAQIVTAPTRRKAPLVVGLGIAIAGVVAVGVVLGSRGSASKAPAPAVAAVPVTDAAPDAAPDAATMALGVDAATDAAAVLAVADECPAGQERTADTSGHCCWRDQAWSSAKNRCVGVPRCPSGTAPAGEGCAESTRAPERLPDDIASRTPTLPSGEVSTFTLRTAVVSPGEQVLFVFPARAISTTSDRSWVAISPENSGPSSYVAWAYVDDNAGYAAVRAPLTPGAYKARLYTHFPKQPYNIAHEIAITVAVPAELASDASAERFTLAATKVTSGARIDILFPSPLVAKPKEKYWVTVVPAGSSASLYQTWEYVAPKARSAKLTAPVNPGAYEVRLHGNYPTYATNVVHAVALTVE